MYGKKHTKWLGHYSYSFENGKWYRHGIEVQTGCRYELDVL